MYIGLHTYDFVSLTKPIVTYVNIGIEIRKIGVQISLKTLPIEIK